MLITNCRKGKSTTTRIETVPEPDKTIYLQKSQRKIHYNKDWNDPFRENRLPEDVSQRKIHYNKDWNRNIINLTQGYCRVAKENPLQQGLKPVDTCSLLSTLYVAKENPLQQGLKQKSFWNGWKLKTVVAKENPLQQGLKLWDRLCSGIDCQVAKENPLQQGLKQ